MRTLVVSSVLSLLTAGLLVVPAGRHLDRELVTRARDIDRNSTVVHFVMELGTDIGKTNPILAALFLPAAFGNSLARGTARVAFLGVGSNQIATAAVKWSTDRERPDGSHKRSNSSFPSGHASGAVGLAWIVGHRHRRLAPWMWSVAIWISLSRVFLERHFVSDILAGAVLGVLFAAVALRFEDRLANWTWTRKA